ncbi:phosphate ABC transporter permease subunit PstC [Stigmatella sp. ncwal1]|uniref:Phosphate transport system permease protein n=1 Tax=Stigmatella ashevillensis TaxID=2995309 RepID=A0ABT5D5R3_9BACT|nr:phosphate ABC transporter permease subunit PstC [Stigmatella ashevillena]MDC0709002.1 phosphate ABC transporter permease subunit PstC [Stigmatella ashevillena]
MQQSLAETVVVPQLSPTARRRQLREKAIAGIITVMAFTGIAALVLIIVFVAKEALALFTDAHAREEASFSKMFLPQVARQGRPPTFTWQPVSSIPKVSMIPLFIGTLKTTLVSMLVAVPLGVAGALFAAEFAPRRLREFLKPIIELLAGIPSVVLGFFALMVLATFLQDTFGFTYRLNAVVAGLGLALAIVPVIFTVAEDALTAVPRSYREASLALGATPWETAWKVVLPAAAPGILAACVLGFGRAIGETMIILMASGNAAIVSPSLGDSVRSLSATIAAEMGEVVVGSPHYSLLFFIGVELFIFTFVLNMVASSWTKKVLKRLTGGAS